MLTDEQLFSSSRYDFSKNPYLQVEPVNVSENLFRCGLYQVQRCNTTLLISEGKVTIEIFEREEMMDMKVTDIALKSAIIEKKFAYLCLSEATLETLKLLISKIHGFIKLFAVESQKIYSETKQKERNSVDNIAQSNDNTQRQSPAIPAKLKAAQKPIEPSLEGDERSSRQSQVDVAKQKSDAVEKNLIEQKKLALLQQKLQLSKQCKEEKANESQPDLPAKRQTIFKADRRQLLASNGGGIEQSLAKKSIVGGSEASSRLQVLPKTLEQKKVDQPMKKLGDRFIFQKNSFSLNKQPLPPPLQLMQPLQKVEDREREGDTRLGSKSQLQSEKAWRSDFMVQVIAQIPEHVMGLILSFIEEKERLSYRVVNKSFNEAVAYCVKRLTFNRLETPSERVLDMLNVSKQLRELTIYNLRHLKVSQLLSDWNVSQMATQIVKLDLQRFTPLNESLLLLIVKHAKNLKELLLPFFSKISDQALLTVAETSLKLERLALKADADNFNRNDKLSDDGLVQVLVAGKKIKAFEVFTVSAKFFECLQEISISDEEKHKEMLSRIEELKIRNILLTKSVEEDEAEVKEKAIQVISRMTNLRYLKIINVMKKDKGGWYLPHTPACTTIASVFQAPDSAGSRSAKGRESKIRRISLGNWCSNDNLGVIAESLTDLEHIRIQGNAVDDSGFEIILQKMEMLSSINVALAKRINGHCFESMISRQLKSVKVTFEEFRLNCLHSTFHNHLQLPAVHIINYFK